MLPFWKKGYAVTEVTSATATQIKRYLALLDGLTEEQVEEALRGKYLEDHVRCGGKAAVKDANYDAFSVIEKLTDLGYICLTVVSSPAKDIQEREFHSSTVYELCVWVEGELGFSIENDRVTQADTDIWLMHCWLPEKLDCHAPDLETVLFNQYGFLLTSNTTWSVEAVNAGRSNEFHILRIVDKET